MRIADLLKKESIDLQAQAADKAGAIDHLVGLMEKGGHLNDAAAYKACVLKREEEGSTGIGEGIAIPHAKTDAVATPGLASMIVRQGVDYESLDDEPAYLFFMIAAPAGGANIHLEVLSRLSRMLMDDDFREKLMQASSADEYLQIITDAETAQLAEDAAEEAAEETGQNEESLSEDTAETPSAAADTGRPYVIGVTACPTGIAHTYMAAERLEKVGHHEKWHLKVETQGALGVENRITAEDIARAEVVLLVTDIEIDDAQRFSGLRTIKTSIKSFLLQPQQIVEAVKSIMKKPVVYVELP